MPHRYFTTDIANGQARLHGDDAHHLAKVMRGRVGDTVILCDGHATEYTGTITALQPDCVEFSVEPGYPSVAEPGAEITLFVGYPKQDKLEQIIRHGVELGAAHIVPFFSRYYECGGAPLRQLLAGQDWQGKKIAVITGSEGGFSPQEAEQITAAGAKAVGLGPRILRCETAPLAALAAIMTLTGDLE